MAPHPPHGPQRGEPPAILPRIISPTATGRASTTHGVLIGYMVAATGSGVASGLAWSRPRTDEELCQGRVYDLDRAAWRGVGRGLGPEFGTSKRGEGESGIGGLGERGSSRPFPQQPGFLWRVWEPFFRERKVPTASLAQEASRQPSGLGPRAHKCPTHRHADSCRQFHSAVVATVVSRRCCFTPPLVTLAAPLGRAVPRLAGAESRHH